MAELKNNFRALHKTLFVVVCLVSTGFAKPVRAQAESVSTASQKIAEQRLENPLYVLGRQVGIEAWLLKRVDETRNSKNVGARLSALYEAWNSIQIKQTYPETSDLLQEAWFSEFAKAPGDIQIFFAGDILRRASEMRKIHGRHFEVITVAVIERQLLSEKMLRIVFLPLRNSEFVWRPNQDSIKAIRALLSDTYLSEDVKQLVRPYLDSKEPLEMARARVITKVLTNFDVVPYAPVPVEEALSNVDELRNIYSKLNSAQKRSLAGDILLPLYRLQPTELDKSVEKLLWEVYESIDDNWFDPGSSIACNLSLATTYYWQKKDFASVIKIERKALMLQESNDGGSYACATRRETLANAFAEAGDTAGATIEFLKAKKMFEEIFASRSILGLVPLDSIELKYVEKRLAELKKIR